MHCKNSSIHYFKDVSKPFEKSKSRKIALKLKKYHAISVFLTDQWCHVQIFVNSGYSQTDRCVLDRGFTEMWNGAEREAFSMKRFTAELCVCSVQPVTHCTMGKGHQECPLQREERPCVHQCVCVCVSMKSCSWGSIKLDKTIQNLSDFSGKKNHKR